jgi:hypothetical protein
MNTLPVMRVSLLPSLSREEARGLLDKLTGHLMESRIPFISSGDDVIIDMCAHIYARRPKGEFTTVPRDLLIEVTADESPNIVGQAACLFFHNYFPQAGIQCRMQTNDRHPEVWSWRVEPKNPTR